jgi:hypothetical protein
MGASSLDTFIQRWVVSEGAEKSNAPLFYPELCDVLGVARPNPKQNDPTLDLYVLEKDAPTILEDGKKSSRSIDLYKHGHFILEAKQSSSKEKSSSKKKKGSAVRGTPGYEVMMNDAYGQALGYARSMNNPPPFLIVCDVGYCFDLYASFDGSLRYYPFPHPQQSRIYFKDLAKPASKPSELSHLDILRAIFEDPFSLDPSKKAAEITREVAAHIADVARALEISFKPEEVAHFLMRCLFTMFAEDAGLLPGKLFTEALEKHWVPNPKTFADGVEGLWRAMDQGSHYGPLGKLLKFNGGLFRNPKGLPLNGAQLKLLHEAASKDWKSVEPAIFGTLIERALSAKERHQLGAHYTPRAYVERLVKPTIEDPLRADWELVQAEARLLATGSKIPEAKKVLRTFHQKLCSLRVLDPACGSGNFLYVALYLFKRLESEILEQLAKLGDTQGRLELQSVSVTPAQFLGIEIKPWAKEIADLVLWIGYLQWQLRAYGSTAIPEPVLKEYSNIECRDAVLDHDEKKPLLDGQGKPVTRWDGETMTIHPVTKEEVPNEHAQVPVYQYPNPRKASWPKADFIVGNPPFIGTRRMRLILGDGYVDALTKAIPEVPENADYVMYWWDKAAELTRTNQVKRFGLITTNSISQTFNRAALKRHLLAEAPLSIVFAIPDHPWVDSVGGAAVRVAMTVGAAGPLPGVRLVVASEETTDDAATVTFEQAQHGNIAEDLRAGASPAAAVPLRSNAGISFWGVKFYGDGFILDAKETAAFNQYPTSKDLVRPFVSGRDLTTRARGLFVLDCDGLDEQKLSTNYSEAYQHLLLRVKPVRAQNPRAFKRDRWWIFGENQPGMRQAVKDTKHYIATTETAKHRVFHFFETTVLAEGTVAVIALNDAYFLGVLSSRIHVVWALAAGGRLGVGNDPRYNKTRCFEPFPFPVATEAQKATIRGLGERLDAHRKKQQAAHPTLTITGMYNVLESLRTGTPLSDKEKEIHQQGLVSILKQLHDELDVAIFEAYGWPVSLTDEELLEKLVALNAERAAEESKGQVRWLRPAFQNPQGQAQATQTSAALTESAEDNATTTTAKVAWPKKMSEQVKEVRALLAKGGVWSLLQVARSFSKAKATDVEDVLDTLQALGVVLTQGDGDEQRWAVAG